MASNEKCETLASGASKPGAEMREVHLGASKPTFSQSEEVEAYKSVMNMLNAQIGLLIEENRKLNEKFNLLLAANKTQTNDFIRAIEDLKYEMQVCAKRRIPKHEDFDSD